MSTATVLTVKSSIFDRHRELILEKDYLTFDNKDRIGELPLKMLSKDIVAFRFGVRWIKGYEFVIGRIYCVDVKSSSGEILKIRFKSLYGVNKKPLAEKYSTIIDALYHLYFENMIRKYLYQYEQGQDFEILGVTFRQNGILINSTHTKISWEDLGTKSFHTYYAIYSKTTPTIYKAFEYLSDWNTGVLYSVSLTILKNKNLL